VPAALQCPDCGHQEMLDHLGGVSTFRCGGCGRALKVPAQFRDVAEAGPPAKSRPPSAVERTQAMPRIGPDPAAPEAGPRGIVPPGMVPPGAVPPSALPSITPSALSAAAAAVPGAPVPGTPGSDAPRRRPPAAGALASAELDSDALAATTGPGFGVSPSPVAPVAPGALKPPLILRLALWAIALPLGSLVVFLIATSMKLITKGQLEDTFLLSGWGRFMPIARLLPFCALATALIVQLGVFGLERLRLRNLRHGPPGRSRPRPASTRPHSPGGRGQRPNGNGNGARSRDRVIS
jgi:hypothetical protein